MHKKTIRKTFRFLANEHVKAGLEHLQAFSEHRRQESQDLYYIAESLQATALKFYTLMQA